VRIYVNGTHLHCESFAVCLCYRRQKARRQTTASSTVCNCFMLMVSPTHTHICLTGLRDYEPKNILTGNKIPDFSML